MVWLVLKSCQFCQSKDDAAISIGWPNQPKTFILPDFCCHCLIGIVVQFVLRFFCYTTKWAAYSPGSLGAASIAPAFSLRWTYSYRWAQGPRSGNPRPTGFPTCGAHEPCTYFAGGTKDPSQATQATGLMSVEPTDPKLAWLTSSGISYSQEGNSKLSYPVFFC